MTIIEMIKTALFFIFFCLVTLIHTTSLFLNQAICKLFNKEFSANKAHQRATAWGRSLFHLTPGWSIKVSGSEHLEKLKQEPAVIVSNHESATDILAFYQLNLQFRWIAKQKIFTFPLIGRFSSMANLNAPILNFFGSPVVDLVPSGKKSILIPDFRIARLSSRACW